MEIGHRKLGQYLIGFIFYSFIALIFRWLITIQLLIPQNITSWLGETKSPNIALWLFSFGFSAIILIALQMGIKLPWIEVTKHVLWDYILGLPLQMLILCSVIGFLGLFLLQPQCEPPAIMLTMRTSSEEKNLSTFDKVRVEPNSTIIFEAKSVENSVVACNWTYSGGVISNISSQSSCITSVSISNQTGNAIITLSASQNFCDTVSTYPIDLFNP